MDADAWVTLGVVLVTLGLAVGTFWLGKQTRDAARSAKEQTRLSREQGEVLKREVEIARQHADAAKQQAELAAGTLAEMQAEREAGVHPRLTVRSELDVRFSSAMNGETRWHAGWGLKIDEPNWDLSVLIANVGRGPAIDAFIAHAYGRTFRWCDYPVSIGAGAEVEVDVSAHEPERQRSIPSELFMLPTTEGNLGFNTSVPTYVLLCLDEFGDRLYRFGSGSPGYTVWVAGEDRPAWAASVLTMAPWLQPSPRAT